jgi:hypothetical protein
VCFSAVAQVLFVGGVTQRCVVESQTVLTQSVFVEHFRPVAHGGHVPPPQSTSVSFPSFMPSVHVAGAHTPMVQTGVDGLEQSAAEVHCTHLPIPSHLTPLPTEHAVPAATSCVPHTQLLQVAVTHGLELSGQSAGFMHAQLPEELDELEELVLDVLDTVIPPVPPVPPVPPAPELVVELAVLLDVLDVDDWDVVAPPLALVPLPPVPPPHPVPAHVARGSAIARPANHNLDECKTTSSMGCSHGTP